MSIVINLIVPMFSASTKLQRLMKFWSKNIPNYPVYTFVLIRSSILYPSVEGAVETPQGCIPWSRLLDLQLIRLIVWRVTPNPLVLLPREPLCILRSASRTEIVRSNSQHVWTKDSVCRRGSIHVDAPSINMNFNDALRRMRNRAMCPA